MQELEWEELIDGESEINAEDINKLAEYAKELNINKLDASDVTTLLTEKVDKEEGKGLSSNDFTDELKTRLLNNTFDGVVSPSDHLCSFENSILKTDIGFIVRDIAYGEDDSYFGVDLYWYKGGAVYHKRNGDEEGFDNEWIKISVSQTGLDNAIGDIEASLENIIEKYGLGGDAQ